MYFGVELGDCRGRVTLRTCPLADRLWTRKRLLVQRAAGSYNVVCVGGKLRRCHVLRVMCDVSS